MPQRPPSTDKEIPLALPFRRTAVSHYEHGLHRGCHEMVFAFQFLAWLHVYDVRPWYPRSLTVNKMMMLYQLTTNPSTILLPFHLHHGMLGLQTWACGAKQPTENRLQWGNLLVYPCGWVLEVKYWVVSTSWTNYETTMLHGAHGYDIWPTSPTQPIHQKRTHILIPLSLGSAHFPSPRLNHFLRHNSRRLRVRCRHVLNSLKKNKCLIGFRQSEYIKRGKFHFIHVHVGENTAGHNDVCLSIWKKYLKKNLYSTKILRQTKLTRPKYKRHLIR